MQTIMQKMPDEATHVDHCYLQWLNIQPSASVLYISQGSFHATSVAQIDEVAAGLRESDVRFLCLARDNARP